MTEQIRAILQHSAGLAGDLTSLPQEADLYQAGLKSLATVKVMLALENAFAVEFPSELLGRETFASIARIEQAILQLRG